MQIYSIIWDLGGVLVRTEDHSPRDQLAQRLGMTRNDLSNLVFGGREDSRGQLGEISYEAHWENVAAKLGLEAAEIPTVQREFFGGDVLDRQLIDAIRHLKKSYCSGLLSNAFSNLRDLIYNEWQIEDAFHNLIISAEYGMMKPDLAIYDLTLEITGFAPEETVFIDDFPQNIAGAREVGMHGILFQSPQQAMHELHALLGDKVGVIPR